MGTSLIPVFDALGYRGEAKQQAVIKLLQASGAFGDAPTARGILSDRQAEAVLAAVTFPTPERAASWLHHVTQAHMLHPPGTEDYERRDSHIYFQNAAELRAALNTVGMIDEVKPAHKHYKHALVMGSMEGGVAARLNTLEQLWNEGVRFEQIHLLGSERRLVPEQEFIATLPNADGKILSTEMQMMQARYYDKSERWPDELRKVPVFAVNTPNRHNGARANTRDTLEAWMSARPEPGNVLVISNQPYVQYQDAVAKAVLPPSFTVESAGADTWNTSIAVAMDSLARRIDVGFPQLLERLKHQKAPPLPKLALFDPAMIRVDAEAYQFRANGNAQGVTTERQYHNDHWDAILHGEPLLVHERLDGSLFVADGHHRLDLAKRLNAQGNGPGMIAAQVLREADGYTVQDAKIIAAYKNIARGQADPVETAHVFKEAREIDHPEWLPSLQMDKGNLRMSYSLSKLSDAAMGYVKRGDVPADKGAMVAEAISDPGQQQATLMRMVSEKLKLRYQPQTQSYHAAFTMQSWPPAITLGPVKVESLTISGVVPAKAVEGRWAAMVKQQRSQAATQSSITLH